MEVLQELEDRRGVVWGKAYMTGTDRVECSQGGEYMQREHRELRVFRWREGRGVERQGLGAVPRLQGCTMSTGVR